jgi:predicted permease
MGRSMGAFWDALAMQPRRLEEEVFQDLRFGLRLFRKNKALTATAVLSLALGIGANTAIFSMIDAALLKKLPVEKPDELVLFEWSGGPALTGMTTDRNISFGSMLAGDTFPYRTFQEFKRSNTTLAQLFAFAKTYNISISVDNRAEIGRGQWVSGEFFSALGVRAAAGRLIRPADDDAAVAPAVVISHGFWQRRFGGAVDVLGKPVYVNNAPFTIAGVTEAGFAGTLQVDEPVDVFIPLSFEPAMMRPGVGLGSRLSNPSMWWVYIMGRTKPGVALEQVQANLQGVFEKTNDEAVAKLKVDPGRLRPKADPPRLGFFSGSRGLIENRQRFEQPLLVLTILVAIVLVIACVNVANLLLARAAVRRKEMSVRLAMGARRFRLVRQVLTESILLAMCGGAGAVALAYFTKDLLLRWGPWSNPANPLTLQLDLRVLAFTAAASVVAALVFGLAPAMASARQDLHRAMNENSRTFSGGRSYLGKTLVVLQVALSVVLLIAAGLFVRTMHNFRGVVEAYDPEHLLQFDVDPSLVQFDRSRLTSVLEQMVERIESVPGVRSASVSCCGNNFMNSTDKASGKPITGQILWVRENFFETMGVPLLMGRSFTAQDAAQAKPVAIVNETFARMHFPGESALGKTANGEIVGVVGDAQFGDLRRPASPAVYWAYRQGAYGRMTFRIRTRVEATSVYPAIRDSLEDLNSELAISNVRTFAEQVERGLAQENMFAGLSAVFGVLAVVLTCVGFYGTMAYAVARRTNEIGVRMALGAKPLQMLRLIMSEGLILVVLGAGLGVLGALASARYIESILFGVSADDGITIIGAVILMLAIAALAALMPARRASRIDPLAAVRYE